MEPESGATIAGAILARLERLSEALKSNRTMRTTTVRRVDTPDGPARVFETDRSDDESR